MSESIIHGSSFLNVFDGAHMVSSSSVGLMQALLMSTKVLLFGPAVGLKDVHV